MTPLSPYEGWKLADGESNESSMIQLVYLMKPAILLSVAAFCVAIFPAHHAVAQDSNYVCYWQKPDGTTADLSNLCQQSGSATRLSGDAAFVADFQARISQYPDGIRQTLNTYINQNRDSAIASAKTTCRVMRFGGTAAVLKRREALTSDSSSPSEAARLQIIEPLAINYYCPEFASR